MRQSFSSHKTALQNVMEGLTVARRMPKAEAEEVDSQPLHHVLQRGLVQKQIIALKDKGSPFPQPRHILYEPLALYIEVGLIYLLFSTALTWLQRLGEKKLVLLRNRS